MAAEQQTLVSVDLDDLACYHGLHGLPDVPDAQRGLALRTWLPRLLDLFAECGVKATLFVIGRDAWRERQRSGRGTVVLRRALEDGHELANHSYEHAYDLVRWPASRILEDLAACDRVLRDLGADVVGFRAPGYTHDRVLLQQVQAMGYRYDSSRLPSPPYYLAKLMVMAWMRLSGRASVSQVGGMSSFFGRTRPHRHPELQLWEFPVSVTSVLRLPLIGTSVLAAPPALYFHLRRAITRLSYVHLELHAIDAADPDADGLAPALVRLQPGLAVPLSRRMQRLREILQTRGASATMGSLVRNLP